MNRRTTLALAISLTVHIAAGVALWQWSAPERIRPLPDRLAVGLSSPPEAVPPAPAEPEPISPPPAREAPRPQPPVAGPAPRPVTAPPAWEPRPYPRPLDEDDEAHSLRATRRHEDVASDWWSRRSAVAFVESWREGGAPRDSVLDRRLTPAERILASTSRGLNENFLRLRRTWRREQFEKEYSENFPPMGQIPVEPDP